jgi:hypothetical protein
MPATAGEAAPTAALVPEVHRAFTLNGNQIPPEKALIKSQIE